MGTNPGMVWIYETSEPIRTVPDVNRVGIVNMIAAIVIKSTLVTDMFLHYNIVRIINSFQ